MTDSSNGAPTRASFTLADGVSLARLPLALAFVLLDQPLLRLLILALAGLSDMADGWLARRYGSSPGGAVLDPATDKMFMATAFGVVLWQRWLPWYAVAAALIRDIFTTAAFIVTPRRMVAARAGGKTVTALQFLTLLSCIFLLPWREALAWLTALAALLALRDYLQLYLRKLKSP